MVAGDLVVDASVVLKWYLDEPGDCEVLNSLLSAFRSGDLRLHIPSHFFFEMGNILSFKMPKAANRHFSGLRMMDFHEYVLNLAVAAIAFDLIEGRQKISFYDASYHALAIYLGTTFVTADKKYYEKMKKEGSIVLLKDLVL